MEQTIPTANNECLFILCPAVSISKDITNFDFILYELYVLYELDYISNILLCIICIIMYYYVLYLYIIFMYNKDIIHKYYI